MKYLSVLLFLVVVLCFSSCNKDNSFSQTNVYLKTIACDSDVVVVKTLVLTDGNYLVVSRDRNHRNPGYMVKLDANGKVLWNKRASTLTNTLWDVFLMPGAGYGILGFEAENESSTKLNVCIYDNEGELTDTKLIPMGSQNKSKETFEVLSLSNGDFALAGTDDSKQVGYLIITDENFKLKSSRSFAAAMPRYYGSFMRGICETSDHSIMVTSSALFYSDGDDTLQYSTMTLKTDLSGKPLSYTYFADSGYSEMPNCLVKYKDGALGAGARMVGPAPQTGYGTLVKYLNEQSKEVSISGHIRLNVYNKDGQAIERKEISGYSNNGQISSIHPTSDGGFILCGTGGQANVFSVISPTEIFLLKIDADLQVQWSKNLATAYPSYGVEALQTSDGGYLISGYHRSFNDHYETLVIKTDGNGNMN